MLTDSKRTVAASYDQLAPYYQHWTDLNPASPRMRYLARLLELLPVLGKLVRPDVFDLIRLFHGTDKVGGKVR